MTAVGGITENCIDACSFEWAIPDYFSLVESHNGKYILSPHFAFSGCTWQLKHMPASELIYEGFTFVNSAMVMLEMQPPLVEDRSIRCILKIKKLNGTVADVLDTGKQTVGESHNYFLFRIGMELKWLRRRKSQLVPMNTLTFMFCLESDDPPSVPDHSVHSGTRVARDLKRLLLSGEVGDATVRVKGQDFTVHRAILTARSEVFAAMFRHDTVEKTSGVVEIEDCEPDDFRLFLHYLYTGGAEDLTPQSAAGLYQVADKYQLRDLMEECLDCIQTKLSVESFCPAVILAIKHGDEELTTVVTNFFCKNNEKIVQTDEWKNLSSVNPKETSDLMAKARERSKTRSGSKRKRSKKC